MSKVLKIHPFILVKNQVISEDSALVNQNNIQTTTLINYSSTTLGKWLCEPVSCSQF